MSRSKFKSSRRIDAVEVTSDCLTGRAGLHLFARYLRGVELYPHLDRLFGSMRKHSKGHPIIDLFIQVFCFFSDGTSRHLTGVHPILWRLFDLNSQEARACILS